MKKNNPRSGVSLIIAIVFVSALLLVMGGLFEIRIRVIQAVGNRETEAKAQYLAQSAVELASFWAATHGVGVNTADAAMDLSPLISAAVELGITNCADIDNDATNGPAISCVGVEVVNRPADAQKVSFDGALYYSAPIRGSGDSAGESVDCGAVAAAEIVSADHSCNWNRLYVGRTMEIPLYYEDADGAVTKLDFSAGSTEEFKLRIRTPENIILYPPVIDGLGGENTDYRDPEKDPVLVQWSIFNAEGSGALTALDLKDGAKRDVVPENTEISGGQINTANLNSYPDIEELDHLENSIILQYKVSSDTFQKHKGKNITSGPTNGQPQLIGSAIDNYDRPVLRLSLVGQPQRNVSEDNETFSYLDGDLNERKFDVPYLEYQVLTKEDAASDSKSLIIGRAEIGGFRKEFRKYLKRKTSASGFAIESF